MATNSALNVKIKLNTGAYIPGVGFGTVAKAEDRPKFKQALKAAILEAGYRHIDTAWYYGTEPIIGEVLKEIFDSGVLKREDIFVTTKVWPSLWNDPEKSLNESLKSLQLDYVDLLLQHWPLAFKSDSDGQPEVPKDKDGNVIFDEDADYLTTYKKMVTLYKTTKKVKAIGVSNYNVDMLKRLLNETDVVPAAQQIELHPKLPQVALVDFCRARDIVVEAYSPFGSTGAPNMKLKEVVELAEKYSTTPADILVNYHLQSGRVSLPRSHNAERVKKGYQVVKLTEEDLDLLTEVGVTNPTRYIIGDWGSAIGFERNH